jgi:hypothetical protein
MSRRLLTLCAAGVIALTVATPASAQKRTVHDAKGDAAAAYDITRVRYSNNGTRLKATVHLAQLGSRGTVAFQVTNDGDPNGGEAGYVQAQVTRTKSGVLRKRLYDRREQDRRLHCAFSAKWSRAKSTVAFSLRRRCLRHSYYASAKPNAKYMSAEASSPSFNVDDWLPFRLVRYGRVSPPKTYFPEGGSGAYPKYRPHPLYMSGDGTYFMTHVRWTHWNRQTARARGTINSDDCNPDCADGHISHYRGAVVRLSNPVHTCGHNFFSRIVVIYSAEHHPAGESRFVWDPYPAYC